METRSSNKRRLTRRHVLKTGAAALGAGAGLLNGPPVLDAQSAQAPAVVTGTQTGRAFRALVRHGSTLDVQEMRLLPIDPRQVVIRSLAVAPCYTIVRGALSTNPVRRAEVPNHCGFGVVEAVGAMVKRVQGQQGGLHVMRDLPRYVKLIEKGIIDAQSVITRRYTLDQGRQAVQDTADRTIITGVVEFT